MKRIPEGQYAEVKESVSGLKGDGQHFGKYMYTLCGREHDVKIDTTVLSVKYELQPAAD